MYPPPGNDPSTAATLGERRRAIPVRCDRVAVFPIGGMPLGAALDVLVPQHRQGDVLALELAVDLSPIGLGMTSMALLGAGGREQRRLQRGVGHLTRQWPAQPGTRQSF